MTVPVLTAVSDADWEAALVTRLERDDLGVTVVRRCVDVADLLAAASAGTARAAVLSAGLRRLDREVLGRLDNAGVAVVGVADPTDPSALQRLGSLGVQIVLPANSGPVEIAEAVLRAVTSSGLNQGVGTRSVAGGAYGDPAGSLPVIPVSPVSPAQVGTRRGPGRLVAVWGPTGAPGRTTIAIGLADEAARLGLSTLLVDADPYGGVVAQALGLLDEAPGLAAAARSDDRGCLDLAGLAGFARALSPTLRVLTGISRADRWPELRPEAVRRVLELARSLADLIVVDCGFGLEQDEEISFDTTAPRRNGATLAAIDVADLVLAVGAADPIGVHRLLRGLTDLSELGAVTEPIVIINRLRETVIPGRPDSEISAALTRFAGVTPRWFLPEDRISLDKALATGRTLAEAAPTSRLRIELGRLAESVAQQLNLQLRPVS